MDVDTSSYPKAASPQQQNPLDQIGKLQNVQRQNIAIDQDKLKLVNEKWNMTSKVLGSYLNKPDLDGKDLVDAHQHLLNQGVMTPEDVAKENSSIPTMAELKRKNPNLAPEQAKALYSQCIKRLDRS